VSLKSTTIRVTQVNPRTPLKCLSNRTLPEDRARDYHTIRWLFAIPKEDFPHLATLLTSQEQYDLAAAPTDEHELLDSNEKGKPITYAIHTPEGQLVGSERIANNEYNLWRQGNFVIYIDTQLRYLSATDEGQKLLDQIDQQPTLQFERLAAHITGEKEARLVRKLTKFAIAASLEELSELPHPLPEISYVLVDQPNNETNETEEQEHRDVFGENLEYVLPLQTVGLNEQNQVQLYDVVAVRFRTIEYINNAKKILEAANSKNSNQDDLTEYQKKIVQELIEIIAILNPPIPPENEFPSAA